MLLVRLCADACGAVADHDAFCGEGKIVHATHSDSTGIYVDGLRSMLDALQLRLLERGKTFNKLGRQKRVHLRSNFVYIVCCIRWYSPILTPTAFFEPCSVKIAFLQVTRLLKYPKYP